MEMAVGEKGNHTLDSIKPGRESEEMLADVAMGEKRKSWR